MPFDSNKSTTKKIEEHDSSHCKYRRKKLKKNYVEAYVWFGFCFCGNEDRSEEYNNIADGES